MARYYILAKGTNLLPSASNFPWPYEVSLCFEGVSHPVAFSEGVGHGATGGIFTAAEALSECWANHIQFANGQWLVPFIEQLSAGASIDRNGIVQQYILRHKHKPQSFSHPNT